MHKVVIIQGLQYGSEAKGSIAGSVAKNWGADTTASAWGPNAGHTVRDGDLRFVSSMLPTGFLFPTVRTALLGPGSVIDFEKLTAEVTQAGDRLRGKMLVIHPRAAYLKPEHAFLERDLLRIGSTMKGTMQAVVSKMHRNEGSIVGLTGGASPHKLALLNAAAAVGLEVAFSDRIYDMAIDLSRKLLVEGAQGFSLSMHGQFYPYCTSRDVSVNQVLADCAIPTPNGPLDETCVIGVVRTYPIRVANRKSEDGQEFTSGGFYEDQHELDWEKDLGREPELTTVTKLPRRIFSFSTEQISKAIRMLRPNCIALTFCDYLETAPLPLPSRPGPRVQELMNRILDAGHSVGQKVFIESLSYGPDASDIYNVTDSGHLTNNPHTLSN